MNNINILDYINKFDIDIVSISEILRYFQLPADLSHKLSPRILINLRDQYYLEQFDFNLKPIILW